MHSWYSERSECRHVSLHFRPTLPTQGALTVARLCPLPSLSPGNKVKLLLASPVLSPGWVGLLSAKGEAGCFPSPSCGTTCDHATKTKEVEGKEGRGHRCEKGGGGKTLAWSRGRRSVHLGPCSGEEDLLVNGLDA